LKNSKDISLRKTNLHAAKIILAHIQKRSKPNHSDEPADADFQTGKQKKNP